MPETLSNFATALEKCALTTADILRLQNVARSKHCLLVYYKASPFTKLSFHSISETDDDDNNKHTFVSSVTVLARVLQR